MKTADTFQPQVPANFAPGSKWTFTDKSGEVRRYVLDSYHGQVNIYRLYREDRPEGLAPLREAAWATPGTLAGHTSTKGWAPAA